MNHIVSVIPPISQQWSAGPIKETLLRFFVKGEVHEFASHIETLSDHILICRFASSLSYYFPHIRTVRLFVKDPVMERVSLG